MEIVNVLMVILMEIHPFQEVALSVLHNVLIKQGVFIQEDVDVFQDITEMDLLIALQ